MTVWMMKGLKTMNRVPRIEIKTIPGVAEEVERHLYTERDEKKVTKRSRKPKAEKPEKKGDE